MECGAEIKEKRENLKIQKKVENMIMRCRYGCHASFPIKNIYNHEKICSSCWSCCEGNELEDQEVGDANSLRLYCHTAILNSEQSSHFENCFFVKQKCSNKGCNLYITRKNYAAHVDIHCSHKYSK